MISWPPGVMVIGFMLYFSSVFDSISHLVWLTWADQEIPAQWIPSNLHHVVIALFIWYTQIARVVQSLTKLYSKYLVSRNLVNGRKFTISQV